MILYADVMTQSIQKFLAVSDYRRTKQLAHNAAHGIIPRSVTRGLEEGLSSVGSGRKAAADALHESIDQFDATETLRELESEMVEAANGLEFEKAALLRDQIRELKHRLGGAEMKAPGATDRAVHYGEAARRKGGGKRRR